MKDLFEAGEPAVAPETGAAVVGTAASFGGLFSAACCCVLPLALAGAGIGTGTFAAFEPFHWPLTALSTIAVAVGWLLYFRRKRRARCPDGACTAAPRRATLLMLSAATLFIALSAIWPLVLEDPLMRLFQ